MFFATWKMHLTDEKTLAQWMSVEVIRDVEKTLLIILKNNAKNVHELFYYKISVNFELGIENFGISLRE